MKIAERVGSRLMELGTVATLVLCAGTLSAASDHQGNAYVRYEVGAPMYSKAGGAPQKLERKMVLHPGDTIITDAKAHVDLALGNNNGTFQVGPNSQVTMEKLTYKYTGLEPIHDTQITLAKGKIYGIANRMAAASKYEIKTPKGVAGIRGTIYGAWDNGNIAVVKGKAAMGLIMPDASVRQFVINSGEILIASVPEVRKLTKPEFDEVNGGAGDSATHGGYFLGVDPATRRFFEEAQDEPWVSPTAPQQ
jgi:hypothetical protein